MGAKQNEVHHSHVDVINRLKRADGHLRKVITMIDDGRPCADVAQQLQAIESAIRNAKQLFIRDHIDHCMDPHVKDGPAAGAVLAEFKQITKYL
ncbi:MAG: metal-sensing transcriptional repressor [Alphaproteobacteria bacterium]|nr:metal-sensing transcriptional repressor [Rhodospirillales bacterium]MCW9044849.1 metal-sensing transcriptional repressor [Alphaproteobacteria bacterium]